MYRLKTFILDSDGNGYKPIRGEMLNKNLLNNIELEPNENMDKYFITSSNCNDRLLVKIDQEKMKDLILSSHYYKDIQKELDSILNLSRDLVTIANKNGIIERVSLNCKKIMGIEKENFIGKSIYELEKSGVISMSSTKRVMKTLEEVSLTQKTKGNRRLYVQGFPIFNEDGQLEKILNVSRDVTEESILRVKLKEAEKAVEQLMEEVKKEKQQTNKIILKSKKIEETHHLLKRVSKTDATVLFLGETGVGKGVFATKLHEMSDRKDNPFINVNCSALPEHLVESELFGYEKGSFTGANNQGKKGLIEAANNGTLFLDEIGELPLNIQAKLLQVLQDQSFMPIGKNTPIQVNVRFVAATNRDLLKMVEEGTFRSDLYYRLNVIPIHIPSLRERCEDIPFLIQHFIDIYNIQYRRDCKLSFEVINQLQNYSWPGNVRELQNSIERLVITSSDDLIDIENLSTVISNSNDLIKIDNEKPETLKEKMDSYEKKILQDSLEKYKTLREISHHLKVDTSTVSRKLKRHGIALH